MFGVPGAVGRGDFLPPSPLLDGDFLPPCGGFLPLSPPSLQVYLLSYGRIRIEVSKSKIMFVRLDTILRVVFKTESESVRFFTYVRT